ncbi:universal stress protein [Neisseria sp. Ec49-e6-T10]|uniref:universal stress protein n=1 Tax=Neisseria sp. Ec49-e6-T10 TaxID=3140744 RepID=UPI003EC014B6
MYKKILIPVDDSQASLLAVKEACKIAKSCGASLYIVHVVDLAQFSWGGHAYVQTPQINEASRAVGDKVLENARQMAQEHGLMVEENILETIGNKIADLLAKEAKNKHCDLIVMGTHGWTGVMHLLMGSVAEGVLKQVDIPIMLLRKPQE